EEAPGPAERRQGRPARGGGGRRAAAGAAQRRVPPRRQARRMGARWRARAAGRGHHRTGIRQLGRDRGRTAGRTARRHRRRQPPRRGAARGRGGIRRGRRLPMKFNLSEWALKHRSLTLFFLLLFTAAGVLAYATLGLKEEPEFKFKLMVVRVLWPGASAEEIERQVTDKIERKLQ